VGKDVKKENETKHQDVMLLSAVTAVVVAAAISWWAASDGQALGVNVQPLRESQTALEARVDEQSKRLVTLSNELIRLSTKLSDNTAILNAAESEFRTVSTGLGDVYVSIKDVEPYGDGYRLTLDLGNPSAATLIEGEGSVGWYHTDENGSTSYESKDFSIGAYVQSGAWTPVKIVIAPADKGDLDVIYVKLRFNGVRLKGGNS
jgi:uncharacterized small protein (DUF1192 family)